MVDSPSHSKPEMLTWSPGETHCNVAALPCPTVHGQATTDRRLPLPTVAAGRGVFGSGGLPSEQTLFFRQPARPTYMLAAQKGLVGARPLRSLGVDSWQGMGLYREFTQCAGSK